jgi:hypothetical protein
MQVKTDIMKDCISPKFLKDVRMDVPNARADVLRVRKEQCRNAWPMYFL